MMECETAETEMKRTKFGKDVRFLPGFSVAEKGEREREMAE